MFWLEPSGRKIGPRTGIDILETVSLRPRNDGLFENTSQSYEFLPPPPALQFNEVA